MSCLALAAPAQARDRCPVPKGGAVIKQSKTIRVYAAPARFMYDRTYICDRLTGKRFQVASFEWDLEEIDAIAYPWVAYTKHTADGDIDYESLRRINVRTGKIVELLDPRGHTTKLTHSHHIKQRSFHVSKSGKWLEWIEDGVAHRAPFR